ncbi:4'-phosphopantetheinyl transferase superfamily protein [Glaciibacter superstes]|uniref:4'-phosphopantetheinyl transferase family protein n=1 Tax=Glaciibacter superstes TaxID=501023 RepID=UPI0003B4FC1F
MLIDGVVEDPVIGSDSEIELKHPLSAAERAAVSHAAPNRLAEFTTVRACAARALRRLGEYETEIVPDAHRAPIWPRHLVGSLTHCEGYCAAAVARKAHIRGIGIDVEPNLPISDELTRQLILGAEEHALCQALAFNHASINWERLIFSAKESLFKAWWPLTLTWLDFDDVVLLPRANGDFVAHISGELAAMKLFGSSEVVGRWAAGRGFIMTSVVLPVDEHIGEPRCTD